MQSGALTRRQHKAAGDGLRIGSRKQIVVPQCTALHVRAARYHQPSAPILFLQSLGELIREARAAQTVRLEREGTKLRNAMANDCFEVEVEALCSI